jgi:diaminohydroxyphosphoribosylaminopyrimidine deaminase / 5-amino-6-(5-phosphoribosylamino)uracil reductase
MSGWCGPVFLSPEPTNPTVSGLASPLDPAALGALLAELGAEARKYRFEVAPNPCVGAAILVGAEVVARGYHREFGGDHAEVDVLARAKTCGAKPEDWDALVVTLEPCSSHGKTPPCCDAILAAGFATVVVGALDPDPRHRGRGVEQLRAAGVEVVLLERAVPLEVTSSHFLHWLAEERLRRPRPGVVAKWAQTLTGQLAPPEDVGQGRWISGVESRAEVAVLRGGVDAIVTGVGTVVADDPSLTVRPGSLARGAPARVVLDTALRTPAEARLFADLGDDEAGGPVHLLALAGADGPRTRALTEVGAQVHGLHGEGRHSLSLRGVSTWLWEMGFRRVLLEAGPSLAGSWLTAGFVDQVRVYTGDVRGGRGKGLGTLLAELRLEERIDRECGQDQVLEAFVAPD